MIRKTTLGFREPHPILSFKPKSTSYSAFLFCVRQNNNIISLFFAKHGLHYIRLFGASVLSELVVIHPELVNALFLDVGTIAICTQFSIYEYVTRSQNNYANSRCVFHVYVMYDETQQIRVYIYIYTYIHT